MTPSLSRILVVTVVHHPLDARIWHRQIEALLEHGVQVTYAAPWTGYDISLPEPRVNLKTIDVPRAQGRRRWAAQRAARRVLRRHGNLQDLVLLHDPELVPTTLGLHGPPVVWDVHEDTASALRMRKWLPGPVRPAAARGVRLFEKWAESRVELLLADSGYAERFRLNHPVVLNTTMVPSDPPPAGVPGPDGTQRVVYLGSVTMERGARELAEVGRRLSRQTNGRVVLEVMGPAHGAALGVLAAAHDEGALQWRGFVSNPEALQSLQGALAGLSLLHDEENFRPSMPTKVVEYLARGVPAISTPLPVAVDLLRRSGGGVVVPFRDVDRTVEQVLRWSKDPTSAAEVGRRGHAYVRDQLDWGGQAEGFVRTLEQFVTSGSQE